MALRITTPLLLCLPLLAGAQTLSWDAPVDVAPANAGTLRPRIVLNGDGAPVVLWANASSQCWSAVGMGGSFMPPAMVSPAGLEIATSDWQGPGIAASGDTLWAVFKGLPEDEHPSYLVGSTDGGSTWSDTLRIDPDDGLLSRFPAVAVGPTGEPVVQYMQFSPGFGEARHVVRQMMGGMFMGVEQVSAPFAPGYVCDCCPGQVIADGDRAVAMYRNAGNNIRTIWGAASTDGGMSFPAGAQLDATNWFLAACPSSGPAGYLAGDSVRYVWMSGEENGAKVYLGSADATTLTAASQQIVHPGQAGSLMQNYPRIAGSGDTLGVVWEQSSGGSREILFAWSTAGVAGLSAPDTVNVELMHAQETPDIAFADGAFHIVWSEVNSGQVRYRRAVIETNTGLAEPAQSAALTELVYDAVAHRLSFRGTQRGTLTVSDAGGRVLLSKSVSASTIDLPVLPAGAYVASLVDRTGLSHTLAFVVP